MVSKFCKSILTCKWAKANIEIGAAPEETLGVEAVKFGEVGDAMIPSQARKREGVETGWQPPERVKGQSRPQTSGDESRSGKHNLEIAGSNPAPATWAFSLFHALTGNGIRGKNSESPNL